MCRSTGRQLCQLGLTLALALACIGGNAQAQAPADFYRGRTVQLVLGYGPGGGYDAYARLVTQHLGKHIPGNPAIVLQHMPGAGSLRATNYLYATAPRDGLTIGAFARDMPFLGVLGHNVNVQFDPRKFTWLGSVASSADDAYLMFVRRDAAIRSIDDLRKQGGPPLVLGVTGEGGGGNDWTILLRERLGLNIKLVSGYPDSGALFLAVERKEIDGRSLDYSALRSSRPGWMKPDSGMYALLQFGRATRHPDFPGTPVAGELAQDDTARRMIEVADISNTLARPFAAPPSIPPDRAKALQVAFNTMVKDTDFLADAGRMRVDVSPLDGDDVLARVDRLANAPPDVLDQFRKMHERAKAGD
jgi:tripartite-type tricarboxylate transporter receptor subunit TctC